MFGVKRNLYLRIVCTLILIITGWMLMYVHSSLLVIWCFCALLFCVDCWSKRKELNSQIKGLFSADAKQNLINSYAFTALFIFIAYGFLFSNEFFSHDSISQTFYSPYPTMYQSYIGIGRFFIPLYETMKGTYSAPWLIGLFVVAWMGLVSFLVIEFFSLKSRIVTALVSGLLCTNVALVLTGATYIYCLDEYAFSLLTSVMAAYCFCKVSKGKVLGILFMILSLGIYQTYCTVACVLCFIFAIQRLLKNEPAAKVISDGLKQIGLMLISVGIYFLIWTVLCNMFQITKNRMNELILGKGISETVIVLANTYVVYFKTLFNAQGFLGYLYTATNIFLHLLLIWKLVRFLKKSVSRLNKFLVTVLMLFAPFAFSSSSIVLTGIRTELTDYAYYLFYILSLVWLEWEENGITGKNSAEKIRIVVIILLGCVIYNNALLANQAYMKKDLEKTATISLVTRLIGRVETLEGYSTNSTPVYVVGELSSSALNKGNMDVPYLEARTGLWSNYSATYNLVQYVTHYMNYPMKIEQNPELKDKDEVQDMPAFPAADSVKMIDGAVVIKLS